MELVNGLLTIIFNLIFFLGSVLITALLFNANSSKSQNLVDIVFNRASLRSPRQYNVVFVHYRHENIVYQFLTCTNIYCCFARDVMAAMLMVKNKAFLSAASLTPFSSYRPTTWPACHVVANQEYLTYFVFRCWSVPTKPVSKWRHMSSEP